MIRRRRWRRRQWEWYWCVGTLWFGEIVLTKLERSELGGILSNRNWWAPKTTISA
jgi:hypothetical protein